MPNILIMPTPLRHRPGRYREILAEAGFSPIDPPGSGKLSEQDLAVALPVSDALLAWGAPITPRMIAVAPRLRAIARAGSGHDAVDLDAATARGIAVSVTPGANADSVAEQVFALLLALRRDVIGNDRSVRAGGWDRRAVRPLRGTTLGIVGLGHCGRAVARRALAFGMRVTAFSRHNHGVDGSDQGIVRLPLEELLAGSDVVSVHLPLTAESRGLFDRRAFARMRRGALLINTARGGLVVEEDLIESLTSGHLGGAGLDVLGSEPSSPGNPLLSLPNVVLSPHIAGVDVAALEDMAEQAARCVVELYRGGWPHGFVLNEELRPGWRW
jgi:phosphoglycerate dehydrogenase-like enzyme